MPETTNAALIGRIFPLRRPLTLAASARFGARRYRRLRDLPGAVPGLLAGDPGAILPRLAAEESRCEQARRSRTAGYRPAQHVQILAALLAEAAACRPPAPEEAGDPPRRIPAPRGAWRAPAPAVPDAAAPGFAAQAKASGSDALRRTT